MFFKKKSFSSAKCKTMLRLATSRIKLLRNMRDGQLKKLKGELANLLKANQEPSAHLKVESIYREQNIMAAYEILELLCQQIANQLPSIEAQKHCPIDLREAVATIIYAAPRCSDIPELQKIRGYMSAKYGKEFTAIAAELRTDCGVNRVVTEKLSIRRPSVEVKLNLMKDVAVEYKLDWDPSNLKSQLLGPRKDLLEGPSQFVGASQVSLQRSSEEPACSPSPGVPVESRTPMAHGSSVFPGDRQFIPFVRPTVEVGSPLSGSQSSSQVWSPHSQGSYGWASQVSSVTSHECDEDVNTQHAVERRKCFKNVVSAARKAAESAERAAAAARVAVAIAGQHLDETGSSTDNESDNDGNETSLESSHYESRGNPSFVESDAGRGLYRRHASWKHPNHRGKPLEYSVSPSVISIERYADNDEDDKECGGLDAVSLSTFMPERHGENQVNSQGVNSRFSTSKSFDHQHANTSSHKRSLEIPRAAPVFDTEEWDDANNENADKAALPILGGPSLGALPKVLEVQTPFLSKSTSFIHPKLPDCDEFVAHFRALKAMNSKK